MYWQRDLDKKVLLQMIKDHSIQYAGNSRLKIFGRLNCNSGKRMKKENRVFFKTDTEAATMGFRPCGHCMRLRYQLWKIKN